MINLYYLTEYDVRPELLTETERKAFDEEYDRMSVENYKLRNKALSPAYDHQDRLLDKYARESGFESYKDLTDKRWDKGTRTPQAIVGMRQFYALQNSNEYKEANDRISQIQDEYNTRLDNIRQDHYYRMFKVTRPRMDRVDVKGNPILDPDEWLVHLNNEMKEKAENGADRQMNYKRWLPGLICREHEYCIASIHEGVLPLADALTDAGYVLHSFNSGMVGDHPYFRYLKDDVSLGAKAGEHKCWGKEIPVTALTLLDKEYDFEKIQAIANDAGMHATKVDYGQKMIQFTLPATRDGSSRQTIEEEFRMKVRGLSDELVLNKLISQYPKQFQEILAAHGGCAIYNDDMIRNRLNYLTAILVKQVQELVAVKDTVNEEDTLLEKVDKEKLFNKYISLVEQVFGKEKAKEEKTRLMAGVDEPLTIQVQMEEEQRQRILMDTRNGHVKVKMNDVAQVLMKFPHMIDVTGRITDITVFRSMKADEPHRLRCKVDGVQQTSVTLTDAQERYWQKSIQYDMKDLAKQRLAAECFSKQLCENTLKQQQDSGMKK